MLDVDYAYAAGIIDGEGTVTLIRNSPKEYRAPAVSVSSTSYEIVQVMHQLFGGTISKHKTYQDHHKQSWMWSVRYRSALETLRLVFPYMKEAKKRKRASLLLSEYLLVTKRNGRYSSNELRAKLNFENRFFS